MPRLIGRRYKMAPAPFFALMLSVCIATGSMQLHESRQLPQGFTSLGPAPPDAILDLRIALTQSDSKGLVDTLMAVSEPSSARYGQYLTKEEVRLSVLLAH